MALDSLLIKVRSALTTVRSNIPASPRPSALLATAASSSGDRLGVLAFEAASLMSKLLYLWRALSDAQLLRLHRNLIALPGVRKLVSDDDGFLLSLARAEFADTLRAAAEAVSSLATRCADPSIRRFSDRFRDFADSGRDPERWTLTRKEMEAKAKKMDKYVAATASLYKQMDELAEREQYLRRLLHYSASASACNDGAAGPQKTSSGSAVGKMAAVAEVQQRVLWQRQEVKHLKEASLWNRTFDSVVTLLARSAFTILARIKHVFYFPIPGCVDDDPRPCSPQPHRLSTPPQSPRPSSVARSLSQSALVHPSSDAPEISSPSPTRSHQSSPRSPKEGKPGFFQANAAALTPPPGTLGAAGLAPRYANVIVILEKMVRCPRSIGPDARDDLYAMLPSSVRAALRARLRGVAGCAATDLGLAEEWRVALGKIAEWLAPLAHNTLRWQAERSFERRSAATAAAQRSGVMLLQTLHFACREKAEATVVELLVGLNYVWRFEMEMSAKAAAAAFFAAAAQQQHQGAGQLKDSPPPEIVIDCNVSFT